MLLPIIVIPHQLMDPGQSTDIQCVREMQCSHLMHISMITYVLKIQLQEKTHTCL